MGMRLFGYYAWHSFVNQVRKLCKTWVLIFLAVCMLLGGLIGIGVAMLEESAGGDEEETSPTEVTEVVEEEPDLAEALGVEPLELVELIVGGVILAVFVVEVLSADKSGSQIFLPADVNLLFASPMKPQSVLLFRLMTRLGTMVLASVYLLLQIPNLTLNMGLSVWAALAVIASWCLTMVLGKLLQILLYTVCTTHVKLKGYIRKGLYVFLALLAVGYSLCLQTGGGSYIGTAVAFFNAPATRLIPFWGWLKGFCMYAMEGNTPGVLLCLAGILAGGAALAYIIWHLKADFYEDAMAKSEETAELLERAQSDKAGAAAVVKRKKDRSERLRRDGLRRGFGANVFFTKAMYNRFRFAHLGVFTKTSETYLVAALGMAALCRFVFHAGGLIPVMLTLAVFCFFRAMGNSLEQDTQMDFFLLIPDSAWSKLFWSLMGDTANCLLDLLPAVVLSALLLGENLLIALAWLPLIVSVSFFATTVGAFIGLSVPVSAGKMVKQIIQIMFVYFGLLPDIAVMAVGLAFGQPIAGAMGCTLLNVLLGLVFFSLCPLFLEPKEGKSNEPERPFSGDLAAAKKHFSRLGFATFVILLVGSAAQILLMALMNRWIPQWQTHPWGVWLVTFAPIYLVAVPIGLLLLRRAPAKAPEKGSLKPGKWMIAALVCVFMMYAGNLLGTAVTALLQLLPGVSPGNPVMGFATDASLVPKVLFMVILAPVIEEYIFRKQLIDRMRVYGEKLAVITSALMFGLFHGNLSQLFYAFGMGLVFGYVYLKTGRLRGSVALHMFVNFLGSVVGPLFLEKLAGFDMSETMDPAALEQMMPWLLGFAAYGLALFGLAIAGLVLLCVNKRKASYAPAELELPREGRLRTVFGNPGMLLLILGCAALIVLSLL